MSTAASCQQRSKRDVAQLALVTLCQHIDGTLKARDYKGNDWEADREKERERERKGEEDRVRARAVLPEFQELDLMTRSGYKMQLNNIEFIQKM